MVTGLAAGGDAARGPIRDPELHACGIGDVSLKGMPASTFSNPGRSSVPHEGLGGEASRGIPPVEVDETWGPRCHRRG